MAKKIKLTELKIKSFVTEIKSDELNSVKGGGMAKASFNGIFIISGTRWTDHDTKSGMVSGSVSND